MGENRYRKKNICNDPVIIYESGNQVYSELFGVVNLLICNIKTLFERVNS